MPLTSTILTAASVPAVQEAVLSTPRLIAQGGGSKPALGAPDAEWARLDLRGLAGILEYQPGEFVFTAAAGTTLAEVRSELAQHGQYLPFDPPLVDQGATLGGAVAAGLNGSGRQRYGGVRDFLTGVRFVDGQGRLVRGGGKVVKNAAGIDLPKLMVGSLGRLGVLVEVSFKVFPQPPVSGTLRLDAPDLDSALDKLARLGGSSFDLETLDLLCADAVAPVLLVRLRGLPAVLPARLAALAAWLGGATTVDDAEEASLWQAAGAFSWLPAGWALVKVPVNLTTLRRLEETLVGRGALRRYFGAGNGAWIGWPGAVAELGELLASLGLTGLSILGPAGQPLIGSPLNAGLLARVKRTLDPAGKFPDY